MKIAIIGTAGRRGDAERIALASWNAMIADARQRIEAAHSNVGAEQLNLTLVSGGAPYVEPSSASMARVPRLAIGALPAGAAWS